ncbi:metallophosphoesterase [Gluconacetobacter diazotrophicus]|uniref:Metallophosphoesterase n=1 Tax=Gluconacetobacter diazotrophicus TaxID=33996 RepID=A0A7W4FDY2_GLUDI|nr:metallophosphoesterase [Gluconacetobacter diazotrophicus]
MAGRRSARRVIETANTTTTTLAHLSDPHLAHDGLRLPVGALMNKRIMSQWSWRRRRRFLHVDAILERVAADVRDAAPDAVALTGDLTNLGLPVECRHAAAWLRKNMPEPTFVVPGNHDMLVRESWPDSVGQWAAWMAAAPDDFPYVRHVGSVALIGVNSARPMPWFTAAGRIGAAQADRLADILHETGRAGAFRVVMIHHPPVDGMVPRRKALLDSGLFRSVIGRAGAEMVLHGHAHLSAVSTLPGPAMSVPVLGIASASMRAHRQERMAAWHHIRVTTTDRGFHAEIHRRIVGLDQPVRALPPWSFDVYRVPRPI